VKKKKTLTKGGNPERGKTLVPGGNGGKGIKKKKGKRVAGEDISGTTNSKVHGKAGEQRELKGNDASRKKTT